MHVTKAWTVLLMALLLVLASFESPRMARAAQTVVPLPITALAPADGQIAAPDAAVQVQFDTSSPAWRELKGSIQSGLFGLRLAWDGHVEWFLPKDLPLRVGSLVLSDAISFDTSTGVITAQPTLVLGTGYSATLAVGPALFALLAQELGQDHTSSASLCCSTSWSFHTATSVATSQTQSGANPTVSVSAGSGAVSLAAVGTGTVTVASYASDPTTSTLGTLAPTTDYFDVAVGLGSSFSTVIFTQPNLSVPRTAYWWNGQSWQPVSRQSYSLGVETITLNTSNSSPTIDQLTGTVFATVPAPVVTGLTPASAPSSGGTSVAISGSGFTGATSVCFGTTCSAGLTVVSDTQITATSPTGVPGATVDVTVTTPGGASAVSSADRFLYTVSGNLLTNGDFSGGMTGWTPACNNWGAYRGLPVACGSFTSISSSGITLDMSSANAPYAGVYQVVPVTSANLTLRGTVTVNRMDECADNGSWIYVTLLDANQQPVGPSLDGLTLTGNMQYGHHPYTGCTISGWSNTSTAYYQDMPAWTATPGAQNFTMPIGSLMAHRLSGVNPSSVAYIKIQLEGYADGAAPSVTFGNLSLQAVPILNVRNLGAVGDGTTNDTQAFQTGLNRLSYYGGGILDVPPGTYSVDPGVLAVKSGITIDGYGATLEPASPGFQLLDLGGTNMTISGLTLEGNNTVVRGLSVETGSTNVILTHDTIQDMTQSADPTSSFYTAMPVGIQIYGNTNDIQVDSSTVNNVAAVRPECSSCTPVARGVLVTADSGQMIGQNVKIEVSTVENVAPKDDGDCIVAQGPSTAANLVIYRNSFDYCYKRAIKIQVPGVVVVDNTIVNPFLGNNIGLGSAYSYSNFPYDMYSAISVYSNNVTVTGNTISGIGSFYNGIEIGDVCSTLDNVTVQNNSVSMGAMSLITGASLIRDMGPITNLAITGNRGNVAAYGITVPPNLTDQIAGNAFTNVASQINYYQAPCV